MIRPGVSANLWLDGDPTKSHEGKLAPTAPLAILAALIVVLAAAGAYIYTRVTYISSSELDCMAVREDMTSLTRGFLEKYPGCRIVARGTFDGAGYSHVECGDTHIVTGSHVAFDAKDACENFRRLGADAREAAVGDHMGRFK